MEKNEKEIEIGLDITGQESSNIEDNPQMHFDLLTKKLQDSENKYLLLYADFENYKKRVSKEKEDIRNNTTVSMITSILDMDNDLSIAIKKITDEQTKQGVQLIASKLENFLKTHGIESIQTINYDEDIHEVISIIETGESKILEVVSKGYSLNGKPFRHPKIVLSK